MVQIDLCNPRHGGFLDCSATGVEGKLLDTGLRLWYNDRQAGEDETRAPQVHVQVLLRQASQ